MAPTWEAYGPPNRTFEPKKESNAEENSQETMLIPYFKKPKNTELSVIANHKECILPQEKPANSMSIDDIEQSIPTTYSLIFNICSVSSYTQQPLEPQAPLHELSRVRLLEG